MKNQAVEQGLVFLFVIHHLYFFFFLPNILFYKMNTDIYYIENKEKGHTIPENSQRKGREEKPVM